MEFRIADTFTDSLNKLTNDEQKAVKTTAFDLQMNPAHPSMQFHKIDRARDPNFWSVRVSRDIRLIVHKTEASLLLCYVDHHDQAYDWAERRRLETHPKTRAAQLVEVRETVKEIITPKYVQQELPIEQKPPVLVSASKEELLSYGVPEEWLDDVLTADEDTLLKLVDHLPAEAAEALLDLATGVSPRKPQLATAETSPFDHPDAQRRFRVMNDVEELERALNYPWEKWTVFLHPSQRELIERNYNGSARVSGSAGTGKTIVALHRAAFLARSNKDARVLLVTFSETLANALRIRLRRLISNEPRIGERLEIYSMQAIGRRLFELHFGPPNIASKDIVSSILKDTASKSQDSRFSSHFLVSEWEQVVDAWQLKTWEEYRDVVRLGRKTRLPEARRKVLWEIFQKVRDIFEADGVITEADMFSRLAEKLGCTKGKPFDFTVIDESQDVSVAQLRFLAALGAENSNGLFFAGDLGQRIFQQPFSWKSLGVDVRGRAHTLRVNYRTSHQIRSQADKLLAPEVADVDGIVENRRGTISVFNGIPPSVKVCRSIDEEIEFIARWLRDLAENGVMPHEVGVFVRSDNELDRACKVVKAAGLSYKLLDDTVDTTSGKAAVGIMHLAKGLEFKAVVVMACDDEILPLQERIESVSDDADLEEVYNTERHLLYVACTRARDHLLVSAVEPESEFLDDLKE